MHALLKSGSSVSRSVEMKTVVHELSHMSRCEGGGGGLLDPADSPNAVTLFGSPPNPDTFFLTCLKFKLEHFQAYT